MLLRAIALDEKALGPESPELGNDLSNLGLLYVQLHRNEEARKAYERALPIEIQAYGETDHFVRDTMSGYAMALRNLGLQAEARKIEDQLAAPRGK